MRITGFIAALAEQGPTRGPQNVFINRRIVKDRTIAHAIIDSYSQASIKERSPGGAPVHRDAARRARRQRAPDEGGGALSRPVARARGGAASVDGSAGAERRAAAAAATRDQRCQVAVVAPLAGRARRRHLPEPLDAERRAAPGTAAPVADQRHRLQHRRERARHRASRTQIQRPPSATAMRPMIPLGQFRDTFIIAVDDEGLAIIDQHVAHERVLFERVMERLTRGRLESQRLLVPMRAGPRAVGASGAASIGRPSSSGSASRSKASAGDDQGDRGAGAAEDRGLRRRRCSRWRRTSKGSTAARRCRTRCSASRRRRRAMPR